MRHWTEKYLQINHKDMDCAKFVEHIIREEFGCNYEFPQSQGSLFIQSHQIREALPNYCMKTKSPKDGDLVLMHGKRLMCHVGIYVRIGYKEYVIHTEAKLKTAALHSLSELKNYGYTVEGIYKWQK